MGAHRFRKESSAVGSPALKQLTRDQKVGGSSPSGRAVRDRDVAVSVLRVWREFLLHDEGVKLAHVAFATRHGKETQLRAAFSEVLSWHIDVAAVDTDLFGTFTGDVPRRLSPRETALAKARRGAEALGLARGLGSEGTIGPHPGIPFLTANHEILAFIDRDEGFELVESVTSTDILAVSESWSPELSLEELGVRVLPGALKQQTTLRERVVLIPALVKKCWRGLLFSQPPP